MRKRRKSRAKILNRIILVQAILVILLIGVLINKNSDETVGPLDSYLTPTQQIQANTNSTPVLTIEPTITPILTVEPTITPTQVVEQIDDENEEVTSTDATDVDSNSTESMDIDDNSTGSDASHGEDSQEVEEDAINTNTNENVPVFARGMSQEFISSLSNTQEGTILEDQGIPSITFYMQTDSRWANSYYGGTDTIEEYGCGPTSLSIVISSLTDIKIDPVQMCAWAYEKGYWFSGQGSLHNLIPEAATAFGLNAIGVENAQGVQDKLRTALSEGKLVIALMGRGSFTRSGHFIVLRGITEDDMVYVADPNSQENTDKTWKLTQIVNEAKSWAGANGPFWVISN